MNPAIQALRGLRAGTGGRTLVIVGEPGRTETVFPTGPTRRPAPTLLEAVLVQLAAKPGYETIAVISGVGPHLPRNITVGPQARVIGVIAAVWLYRGSDPRQASGANGMSAFRAPGIDADTTDSYADFAKSELTSEQSGELIADLSGSAPWDNRITTIMGFIEAACGRHWEKEGYRRGPSPPPGRTLVIVDEEVLIPGLGQHQSLGSLGEFVLRILKRRLDSLPELVSNTAGSPAAVDLVLLARSPTTAESLRSGRMIHDQLLALNHPQADRETINPRYPRMEWEAADFSAETMPRLDQNHPLADYFPDLDPKRPLYDILRRVEPRPVADPMEELDRLIGLERVKEKVRKVFHRAADHEDRRERGLPLSKPPMLHLVFAGNPGTGKTTVAKIVARLYAKHGLLSGDKVTQVKGKDLISKYIRATDEQADMKLQEAAGGVLFIDEAYSMIRRGNRIIPRRRSRCSWTGWTTGERIWQSS